MVLVAAGMGFLLAGLVAIAYGVPVHEFSFGNTLILSGSVACGTGAVLLGLSAVLRELKVISRGLIGNAEPRVLAPSITPAEDARVDPPAGDTFARDRPLPDRTEANDSVRPGGEGAHWPDEAAQRPRAPSPTAEPASPPPQPAKVRRNLLFSSTSRRERERAAQASLPDIGEAAPAAASSVGPARAPAGEPGGASGTAFDQAWPEPARARLDPAQARRRSPPAAEPPPEPPAPAQEEPAVTVLKSGVVDGMAYSLYSDGSIEAQMPEGMMRFASIDELRSHLDQRPS